ncbi:hypothetical protein H6P81_000920 [Aristolochia fimbriata]|uniref:Uncharacterized protein n=1 Tax=Aristolochia fimbriata TaxID=158543 RepID=A0AAV7F5L0_ARIFI|nr:hypothetical protein H6P81_000920 [Aristolochia fimbriata]
MELGDPLGVGVGVGASVDDVQYKLSGPRTREIAAIVSRPTLAVTAAFFSVCSPAPRVYEMCPLRFILVFFSAALAGYFAWRSFRETPGEIVDDREPDSKIYSNDSQQEIGFGKTLQNVFWVFVDMASGRYLWRNWGQIKERH